MNPTSVDVKDMLDGESSLELTFATDLFVGKEPTAPKNCVTIFDTPGRGQDVTLLNDSAYYYPSFFIRVRNTDYQDGWALIDAIRTFLHGKEHETWNGTEYQSITCSGEPALLEWDENGNAVFFANFNCQRR